MQYIERLFCSFGDKTWPKQDIEKFVLGTGTHLHQASEHNVFIPISFQILRKRTTCFMNASFQYIPRAKKLLNNYLA